MSCSDEARVLRQRLDTVEQTLDRLDRSRAGMGAPTFVLRTKSTGSYPTTAAAFYTCDILKVGGVEATGSPVTLDVETGPVLALNVGTKVPPEGTTVMATVADGLYCFQFDGSEA